MQLLNRIYQFVEAFATATAVVFGLRPDPTRIPVKQEIYRRR
jgi:hypothetical protein